MHRFCNKFVSLVMGICLLLTLVQPALAEIPVGQGQDGMIQEEQEGIDGGELSGGGFDQATPGQGQENTVIGEVYPEQSPEELFPVEETPFEDPTLPVQLIPVPPKEGIGGGPLIIVRYRENTYAGQASKGLGRTLASVKLGKGKAAAASELVELNAGKDITQALKELKARPEVLYAEPNYPVQAFTAPNDPLYVDQWGLSDYADTDYFGISAEPSWDSLTGNGGSQRQAVVAVVDTGVDVQHVDLTGRLADSGFNSITGADPANWDDNNGHGTHVAGIIAAETGNGVGIAGAAGPANVEILPVKALDSQGNGSIFDVARGIFWAVDHEADVINLSLGTNYYSQTLLEAVQYAIDNGVVVVAAAGNEGTSVGKVYPASLPGVIAVSAIDEDGDCTYFSNYGPEIDLAAPGEDILSTYPVELDSNGDGYKYLDGTSMAAPFVAGVAGLLLSVDSSLTAGDVQSILKTTGIDLGSVGKDDYYGYGVVNAQAALVKVIGEAQPEFSVSLTSPAPGVNIVGTTTVSATVSDPEQVDEVDFYVSNDSIGRVDIKNLTKTVTGAYSFDWTPSSDNPALDDGQYTLYAAAKDSLGNELGKDSVTINIVQQIETGLSLHIAAPGDVPAGSAEVYVFEVERDGDAVDYDEVYNGTTDMQGDLRIPSTSAPDGKEYLVTVNGIVYGSGNSDGESSWFFYKRIFDTANGGERGRQVIDGSQAIKVNPSTNPVLDLTSGRILIRPQGLIADDGPLTALGAYWLASEGPSSFWVDPGIYDFILAGGNGPEGSAGAYYLQVRDKALDHAVSPEEMLTFTVGSPVQVDVTHTDDSSIDDLTVSLAPWEGMHLVMPQELAEDRDSFDISTGSFYISEGTYDAYFDLTLEDRDNSLWEYLLYTGSPWTVAADGSAIFTIGQNLQGRLESGAGNEYSPGGDFSFYGVVDDNSDNIIYLAAHDESAVTPVNPQLLGADGLPVPDGIFDAVYGYGFGSWDLNGSFSEQLLTNETYTLTMDIPMGPLGSGGAVTASSDNFTINGEQTPEGIPLDVVAQAPIGESWVDDTSLELWLYEITSNGYEPVLEYYVHEITTASQSEEFMPEEVYLDPAKRYYAVLTGTSSPDDTGVIQNVVVYSREITVAETINLEPAAGTRAARLRSITRDGGEWQGGSAGIYLSVLGDGSQEIGNYDGTIQFRESGQANMYLDDGTYDLVTTSWISSGDTPLYTEMGALNDVHVDNTTTTLDETRLKIDFTNGPNIKLLPDEPVDDLDLVVTPQGIDYSTYWDDDDITSVPTYFTPGTYQMLLEYDPLDSQGSFPEGDWWYDLVPAAADADGNVTLATGQNLEWQLGGNITSEVNFEEKTAYLPGETLTITAATSDAYKNRVVYVGSIDENIWYDEVSKSSVPGAQAYKLPAAIDRGAKAVLKLERVGEGLVARAENAGGVQTYSHNSPVFLIRRDSNQEVLYRNSDESYFKRVEWTIPGDIQYGGYTVQYLVSIDGKNIFESTKSISVKTEAGAIADIDVKILAGVAADTLNALKVPLAGLVSIVDAYAADYQAALASARSAKGSALSKAEIQAQINYVNDLADVAAAKAALTFNIIKGANSSADNIISNLDLKADDSTFTNRGVAISWATTAAEYVTTNGTVTRPAWDSTDAHVELTATLSKNEASDTVEFNIIVKRQTPILTVESSIIPEGAANNGTITATQAVNLTHGTFAADLSSGVTVNNLPAGLGVSVSRDSDTKITISFTGAATAHSNANDVTNASVTVIQAKINGALNDVTSNPFTIDFANPPSSSGGGGGGNSETAVADKTQQASEQALQTINNTNATEHEVTQAVQQAVDALASQNVTNALQANQVAVDAGKVVEVLSIAVGKIQTETAAAQVAENAAKVAETLAKAAGKADTAAAKAALAESMAKALEVMVKAADTVETPNKAAALAAAQADAIEAAAAVVSKMDAAQDAATVVKSVSTLVEQTAKLVEKADPTAAVEVVKEIIGHAAALKTALEAKTEVEAQIAGETRALEAAVVKTAEAAILKSGTETLDSSSVKTEGSKAVVELDSASLAQRAEALFSTIRTIENELSENNISAELNAAKKVVIEVPTTAGTQEVETKLPAGVLEGIGSKGIDQVEIKTGVASIAVPPQAFGQDAKNKEITLAAAKVETDQLPSEVKDKVPSGSMVVDLNAAVDGERISQFEQALEVGIPYNLKAGENPLAVTVFLLKDDGMIEAVGGKYDAATGKVVFSTRHFSRYFAKESMITFADLSTVPWAKEPIGVLAGKGIVSGRGKDTFDPNAKITRAEFAALMAKMVQLEADADDLPFEDVTPDKWYYGYVKAAYTGGLIKGKSAQSFDPDGNISRQEMAAIISNVLLAKGCKAAAGTELNRFSDTAAIAVWAKTAVALAAKEGIVSGIGGEFKPEDKATRAQAAVMLYNLFKK